MNRNILNMSERHSAGPIIVSPGVIEKIVTTDVLTGISRHISTANLRCPETKASSGKFEAIHSSKPLCSKHCSASGIAFLIITEPDHSATTVMLPEEC